MSGARCFVYIIKSQSNPDRHYTGLTSDVAARLAAHNAGHSTHTARFRPWQLDVVIEFADESRAIAFEKYLKSGSGVAFAQRHFRQRQVVEGSDSVADRREFRRARSSQ